MRKFVITLAAAGAALVVATPAAAQFYPQPQGYGGYGGYGYGQNAYGQVRALQARLQAVRFQIDRLGGRGQAERLRDEARNIDHRLRRSAQFGLNPYEASDINSRISRLQQRVQFAMANRYRYGGYGGYGSNGYNSGYGYNGYNSGYGYTDRDGDDRDDSLEHQRWHEQHDGDRDDDRDDDHDND
jgi:opacity protein-like surface antigen